MKNLSNSDGCPFEESTTQKAYEFVLQKYIEGNVVSAERIADEDNYWGVEVRVRTGMFRRMIFSVMRNCLDLKYCKVVLNGNTLWVPVKFGVEILNRLMKIQDSF